MYYLLFFLLVFLYCMRHDVYIWTINTGFVSRIQWTHRGKKHILILTPKSIARMSHNRNIRPTMLLKHFWLDDKLCHTDSFLISKLSLEKIIPNFTIAMFKKDICEF